jgi:hypothetical protein
MRYGGWSAMLALVCAACTRADVQPPPRDYANDAKTFGQLDQAGFTLIAGHGFDRAIAEHAQAFAHFGLRPDAPSVTSMRSSDPAIMTPVRDPPPTSGVRYLFFAIQAGVEGQAWLELLDSNSTLIDRVRVTVTAPTRIELKRYSDPITVLAGEPQVLWTRSFGEQELLGVGGLSMSVTGPLALGGEPRLWKSSALGSEPADTYPVTPTAAGAGTVTLSGRLATASLRMAVVDISAVTRLDGSHESFATNIGHPLGECAALLSRATHRSRRHLQLERNQPRGQDWQPSL